MENKLVSVIIPTYRRSNTLSRTIDSVLCQTYTNIEVIVVDDNGLGTEYQLLTETQLSTYISKGLITYIKHSANKNGAAARNTGFRASKGDYINFLDDDDRILPNKIELQVMRLLKSGESEGAVYCNSTIIRKQFITKRIIKTNTKCSQEGNLLVPYLLENCPFNTSAILFKREVIESLGGFDESWRRHQDYELMTRFFQHNTILCCSLEPLLEYDVTGNRINLPNCKKQYELEKRFLSTFKSFIPSDMYSCIHEKFWIDCMRNCLFTNDYETYRMATEQLFLYGSINWKQRIKLVKSYIMGLLNRIGVFG